MQNITAILLIIVRGIIGLVIALIPLGVLALISIWLCDIDVEKNYKWYSGIWHALWFLPNLIKSIFTDGLWKAEIFTTGYNVWWWITNIIGLTYMFFEMKGIVTPIIIIVILFQFL